MPQAIGRHNLFSTCFLLLAAEVRWLHLRACTAPLFFSPVQASKLIDLVTRGVFSTRSLIAADQRPDEVSVTHLCVASYITLQALVCIPSGCCEGGG